MKIQHLFRTIACSALIVAAQPAYSGRVVVNHDEWTFTGYGIQAATPSTAQFAANLASFMNIDGGSCKLLVYSSNFGLTGSMFKSALESAGCSVTASTGAFTSEVLSGFDGVLLAGTQYNYNGDVLASYVDAGHSVYIAAGTAAWEQTGGQIEGGKWDSFMHQFGLDFGAPWNGIEGVKPIGGAHPLLQNVSGLYFNNGNTVNLVNANPYAQIIASYDGAGLLGVYDNVPQRDPSNVPEPGTLALFGFALSGVALFRRRLQR